MLLDKVDRQIEKSVVSESFFSIDVNNQAHIISILRDKLYSDKILAVVREYYANALDANFEAGNKGVPIEICCPSAFNPTFKIRDFGPGMTEEEVINTYIKYGLSTKRSTNDVIGQLGIGSKSGFAYSDSFAITTWKGGIKRAFTAYIDETGVGKLASLGSEPCDDRPGVEISIPVKPCDVPAFEQKIRLICEFADVKPVCNIELRNRDDSKDIKFDVSESQVLFNSDFWTGSVLVMGNIPYDMNIQTALQTAGDPDELIDVFRYKKIVIRCPIGSVSVSASRESLEYTKKTSIFIRDTLKETLLKAVEYLRSGIAAETNIVDAKRKYKEMVDVFGLSLGVGDVTWRGFDVTLPLVECSVKHQNDDDVDVVAAIHRVSLSYRGKTQTSTIQSIPIGAEGVFIVDTPNHIVRATNFIKSGKSRTAYLIDVKDVAKLNSTFDFDNLGIARTSSLPIPPKVAKQKTSSLAKTGLHSKDIAMFDFSAIGRSTVRSTWWKPFDGCVADADDPKVFYVPIDMFKVVNKSNRLEPIVIHDIVKWAKVLDVIPAFPVDQFPVVVGVKHAKIKYAESTKWSNLISVIEQAFSKNKTQMVRALVAHQFFNKIDRDGTLCRLADILDSRSVIRSTVERFENMSLENMSGKMETLSALTSSDFYEAFDSLRRRAYGCTEIGSIWNRCNNMLDKIEPRVKRSFLDSYPFIAAFSPSNRWSSAGYYSPFTPNSELLQVFADLVNKLELLKKYQSGEIK